MKYFSYIAVLLAAYSLSFDTAAQNEIDVLRYSFIERGGSARFISLGGAMGALGADFGALSTNPAAAGVYRQGEVMFTGGIVANNLDGTFAGQTANASDAFFHVNNAGIVFTNEPQSESWKKVSLAFGYNKHQLFRGNSLIDAPYNESSLLTQYVAEANGIDNAEIGDSQPFGAGLAWNNYLINPYDDLPNQYIAAIAPGTDKVVTRTGKETGGMGEMTFTLGGNYEEWLFLGATLGLTSVNYSQRETYREDIQDLTYDLDSFEQITTLSTSGGGANIKAGAIIKLADYVRIGASVHSSTVLNFDDTYSRAISTSFRDTSYQDVPAVQGVFNYRIKTPARYLMSGAFILGKQGFISAEYEFVNYANAEIRPASNVASAYNYDFENRIVDDSFRSTHNIRVGAEWRASKEFKVRGGVSMNQNPYKPELSSVGSNFITYSGGIGYKKNGVFVDLGYRHSQTGQDLYMYDPGLIDAARLDKTQGEVVFTVGCRIQ